MLQLLGYARTRSFSWPHYVDEDNDEVTRYLTRETGEDSLKILDERSRSRKMLNHKTKDAALTCIKSLRMMSLTSRSPIEQWKKISQNLRERDVKACQHRYAKILKSDIKLLDIPRGNFPLTPLSINISLSKHRASRTRLGCSEGSKTYTPS